MKVYLGPYKDEGERIEEVQIHDYDTWNMDNTLAMIVLPMLKQLKDTKQGAPYVDPDDVPKELRPKEKDEYGTDDTHFARWDWVMNEMIFAFQHKVDDDWEEQFFSDEEPQYEIAELEFKGVGPCQLRLFPDEHGEMEDYEMYEWVRGSKGRFDKEGYQNYQKRISNGFRLFGKYYEGLWD
jgi:hypothetical protein